jgi:hypothetical protein
MNQLYLIVKSARTKEEKKKHNFLWCLSIFGVLTFGWAAKKINGM